MRILICNERFLFRFGVDRVLLMLGSFWKKGGHEIIMMGNKLDSMAVNKCSDRFIPIPEAPDYLHGNEYTADYLNEHWEEWFEEDNKPDIAVVAGWPFYCSIELLKKKCGCIIFHDYGAVPTEGMSEPQVITQNELRRLRRENLKLSDKIIAISSFLEETQSKPDAAGIVPTSYVHLGIDHIAMNLWNRAELGIAENNVIADIKKLKQQGYKIIFQPGRWENDNYKNSAAGFELAEAIVNNGIKIKILVLANESDIGQVSKKIRDCYYCTGFIDDATMRKAMELSDLGFSPTLWEGFNLPLGEMQYLNKCMYVFNVGAHSEVVADPYFLCADIKEAAKKIIAHLRGKIPFSQKKLDDMFQEYRENFTWQKSAEDLMEQMSDVVKKSSILFIDVTNACHDTANTGVMRVTRKLSHFIQGKMNTIFILWDESIKKFVFPYPAEVETMCSYGGPNPELVIYKSVNGQPRKLLDEVIDSFGSVKKFHLFTETVNSDELREAIPYFHAHNVYVSAVFYDAIPVLRPELVDISVSDNHKKYMTMLSECDLIIPIADHNGLDLKDFWKNNNIDETQVKTANLAAEMDKVERNKNPLKNIDMSKIKVLFVSTLEPRKNHIRFLSAVDLLFSDHPELEEKLFIDLVGNRYAGNTEIPEFVEIFCKNHSNVKWHGVVSDEMLQKLYSECTFTVYPSEIEGFGMPIIESLWCGKPCLCSDSGSIGELGEAGGCFMTNVTNERDIAEALYELSTNNKCLLELCDQAVKRPITTWREYADSVSDLLLELNGNFSAYENARLNPETKKQLLDWLDKTSGDTVIFCANYYPPNFIGGAEIIAHNQAITLARDTALNVAAVSLDVTGKFRPSTNYLEFTDGIPVVRISVSEKNFDNNGINFFDKQFNSIFDEICALVKPKVVHCHNIIGMSLGIVDIAKKHRAKVCITLHDNWGICYKNTLLNRNGNLCGDVFSCEKCKKAFTANGMYLPIGVRKEYFRRTFEKIDEYISPSQYLANTYIRAGFNYHKMNVLRNGIEFSRFAKIKKIPSDKLRITFIGYFGKHKGVELLIKAVGLLADKNIEIELVGFGDQYEEYKKIAAECGILHQLRFWGKLPNELITNVYAETDIYCLPSIWPENQPVSITEAMACGIPVIASDLGGSAELVNNGKTGFLFKALDYKDLASKIKLFLNNRNLINTLGKAGQLIMQDNSYHDQIKKLTQIYAKAPKMYSSGKKIIAVKGTRIPEGIEACTAFDIMLMDWIISDEDRKDICAYILPPGEKFTKKENKLILASKAVLFVEEKLYSDYVKKGCNVRAYISECDLLEKVAEYQELLTAR